MQPEVSLLSTLRQILNTTQIIEDIDIYSCRNGNISQEQEHRGTLHVKRSNTLFLYLYNHQSFVSILTIHGFSLTLTLDLRSYSFFSSTPDVLVYIEIDLKITDLFRSSSQDIRFRHSLTRGRVCLIYRTLINPILSGKNKISGQPRYHSTSLFFSRYKNLNLQIKMTQTQRPTILSVYKEDTMS